MREPKPPKEVRDSLEAWNTLMARIVQGMLADGYTVEQVYAASYPKDYAAISLALAEMGQPYRGKRIKRRKRR